MALVDGITMYEQANTPPADLRIEDYAVLVKRIAQHMMARMPASVQIDDLIQAGMVGLLEASRKYDTTRGASFETYAGIRIRGAMVDEMRKGDWVPRSVHRNARRISEAISTLEAKLGRNAKDGEVADALNMDLDEYYSASHDAATGRLFSIDDSFDNEDDDLNATTDFNFTFIAPHDSVQKDALKHAVAQAIKGLSEREQMVLALYYDEELNLKEIGQVLGVSESRVSQIHSQATLRLKSRLGDWQAPV